MPVRIYVDFGYSASNKTKKNNKSSNDSAASVGEDNEITNRQEEMNKAQATAKAVGKLIALQTINYATSNVGQWTGNKQTQVAVDNIKSLVGVGFMIKASPWMAAATVGLQLATTAIDENIRKRKESVGLAQARARAGYTNDNAANYRRR